MKVADAFVMIVYVLSTIMIVTLAILALHEKDYTIFATCAILHVIYSVMLVHEYKRDKKGGKR